MTDSDLQIIDPGERGRDWVTHRLREGLTLSRLVMDTLDADLVVETAHPPDAIDRGFEYSLGGLPARNGPRSWFVQALHAASPTSRLIVAEDRVSLPSDPVLARARTRWFALDREVYVVAEGGASLDELSVMVSEAKALHGFAIFVGAYDDAFAPGREPSVEDLRRYAGSVRWIGVDAYDGESYVVAEVAA